MMTRRFTLMAVLAIVSGCSVNTANPSQSAQASSDPVATVQSVSVASAGIAADTIAGAAAIADNFTFTDGIEPTWYGPTGLGGIPGILTLNDTAGFRIDCWPAQLLHDDSLFDRGQPGAAHLHLFWGNTGANANSTYTSLRTTGGT